MSVKPPLVVGSNGLPQQLQSGDVLDASASAVISSTAFASASISHISGTEEELRLYGKYNPGTAYETTFNTTGQGLVQQQYVGGSNVDCVYRWVDGGGTPTSRTGTFPRISGYFAFTNASLDATGPGVIVQASAGAALTVVQSSGTGETAGFTAGSGTPVNDDSTFTGNVGSTAYNLNDIVKALKSAKILAD